MSSWVNVVDVRDAKRLIESVNWPDSFLWGATLYSPVQPVKMKSRGLGIAGDSAPHRAWVGILADTWDGIAWLELVAEDVEKFSVPAYLDADPFILLTSATLPDNRRVEISLEGEKANSITSKSLKYRMAPVALQGDSYNSLRAPSRWSEIPK